MITLNNSNIDFGFDDESLGSKYSISLSRNTSNIIFKTEDVERMTIMKNGKVGIGKTETIYNLDVNGSINTGSYLINGQNISTITRDTSNYIEATSNILVGHINNTCNFIKDTSNILVGSINNTSNYVWNTSNILVGSINNTSNYVRNTSNILVDSINKTSNYISNTSNDLSRLINDTSNYVNDTSNIIFININNTCNYTKTTSNTLISVINDTSNYVNDTCNILIRVINDTSNYVNDTCNIVVGKIVDTSNYVIDTSNTFICLINDTSNYVKDTSNIVVGRIVDTSNYVIDTSNILVDSINKTSNYISNTSNTLIGFINETSNYTRITSNILVNSINNTCNYLGITSNILVTSIRNSNSSNYVRTTSNILDGLIKSTITILPFSSPWTITNNNISYNTSNVGIGTNIPVSKLHLYDDISKTTKLTIQNNKTDISGAPNSITDSDGLISSTTINTVEKLIKFDYKLHPYTFTTNEVLICDILLVGGGGGGGPSGITDNIIDDATLFDKNPLSPYLNKPLYNSSSKVLGGATAVATILNGTVSSISMTNAGSGYTIAPNVVFTGGGGTGAEAIVSINDSLNYINGIYITNVGRNYTSVPTVEFTGGDIQTSETLSTTGNFILEMTPFKTATSSVILPQQSRFSNIFNQSAVPYIDGTLPFMVFEDSDKLFIYKSSQQPFIIKTVEIVVENFLNSAMYNEEIAQGKVNTSIIATLYLTLFGINTDNTYDTIGYDTIVYKLGEFISSTTKTSIINEEIFGEALYSSFVLHIQVGYNLLSSVMSLETTFMFRKILFKGTELNLASRGGGGGAGGAGGYVYLTNTILPQGNYTVTVGKGGSGIINGSDSKISGPINYIAYGGGYGGDWTYGLTYMRGGEGGSGGGAGFKSDKNYSDYVGGRSLQELLYGYGNGGNGNNVYSNNEIIIAGGGGGAGGFITNGNYNNSNNTIFTGFGVNGLTNSITGSPVTYAGGGGGSSTNIIYNKGGSGGGGDGLYINLNGEIIQAKNGEDGKGGGGGGGKIGGTTGGNGVVIIRYKKYQTKESSVELIIGSSINNNVVYKIGNYDGILKITSSISGTPTDRLVINNDGNIGIGTTNPKYRLDVVRNSNPSNSFTSGIYFNFNTLTNITSLTLTNMCAKFNGSIWITGDCYGTSDIRIKEDIQDINYDSALQMILAIEPKTYKYIDKIENGNKKVYGFIAQQVQKVIPEAVSIENAYIPNVMMLSDYNEDIIILPNIPNKVVIKLKDKLKCYDCNNNSIEVEVIEIINYFTFKIKDLEKKYKNNKIFVYGTLVNDFHTLSKEYIYTLNVGATHELYRQIKEQGYIIKSREHINDLHIKNKDLNVKYEKLLKELTLIKKRINS